MTPDRPKAARDLLDFYMEAGADALLGEAPVDRFADQEPARSPAPPASGASGRRPPLSYTSQKTRGSGERPAPPTPAAPPSPDVAATDARQQARQAASLDELRRILESFEGCELKRHAKQLVFADGNPEARVMFVGEA
ncbi:MAG: uracil-DNA glycosylase, partial [Alphaproteobacteria bacterium]|nr:uracil-DNA glycosylase [Alphaproteobacteria bacterium]